MRSSDGGKLKIGNTRIDLWSGYLQVAQLFVRVATGQRKSQSGRLYDIDRTDLVKVFARSKSAPLVNLILDAWNGRTFYGERFGAPPRGKVGDFLTEQNIPEWAQGVGKETWNRLMLLVVQDATDALIEEGYPMGVAAGTLAFYGTGVQTYEVSPSAKLQSARDDVARQIYNKNWDELKPSQQKRLRRGKSIVSAEIESKRERRKLGPAQIGKHFLKDVLESGQRIHQSMPEEIQTELELIAMTTGGISKTIAGGYFLNDKRYETYEKYATEELERRLGRLIVSRGAIWRRTNQASKVKRAKKEITAAKARARKRLLRQIEIGSL